MTTLLQRVAQGEAQAAKDCIAQYSRLVWALAARRLRHESDVEDVVQETFISLWQSAHRFDPSRAKETTFVAMIARRRIVDRLRSATPDQLSELEEEALPVPPAAERLIESRRVAHLVDGLPQDRRRVLWLAIAQGLSHREIADRTGLPMGTVKSHFRRGLLEVRARLRDALTTPLPLRAEAP